MEGKVTVSPVCLEPCCSFPGDVGLVLAAVPVQHGGSAWLSPAPVNVPINHGSPGCSPQVLSQGMAGATL